MPMSTYNALHATGKTTPGGVSGDLANDGYHSAKASRWSIDATQPKARHNTTASA